MRRLRLASSLFVLPLLAACEPSVPPLPELRSPARAYPSHKPRKLASQSGGPTSLLDASLDKAPDDKKKKKKDKDKAPKKGPSDWILPDNAGTAVGALMRAAAHDDVVELRSLLAPGAGYGNPDRREIGRRDIRGEDGGIEFLTRLRDVASRFPDTAAATCSVPPPGIETYIQTGSESYWCWYQHQSGDPTTGTPPDWLVVKLVYRDDRVLVDYVGFWDPLPLRMPSPMPELGLPPGDLPVRKSGPGPLVRDIPVRPGANVERLGAGHG